MKTNKSEMQEFLTEAMRLCLLMEKDIDKVQDRLNGLKRHLDRIEKKLLE